MVGGVISAQPAPASIDSLVSAAKVAAGTDWQGTFTRLCIPLPETTGGPRAEADPRVLPPREKWHAEPAKVGDNFYFIGEKAHHSWALVGSDGIIVIEALSDYMVGDEVAGGLRKLGLDMNKVKYTVMSHAHADHDGGASYMQDSFPASIWSTARPTGTLWKRPTYHAGGKPKRDVVGTDGMTLSVGDASLKIVTMPGHTAGTLSYLFEFKDNGKPVRVAYVGGTAIPFNGSPAYYDEYIASSQKFAKAAADYGATVLLSNHTEFDNGYYKAQRQRTARPERESVRCRQGRRRAVLLGRTDCAQAAKLRASTKR